MSDGETWTGGRTQVVDNVPVFRRIGRLDPGFKADLPIREAQIIQEDLDNIRVLYVPVPGTSKNAAPLVGKIQERLGQVQVDLEEVEQIARSSNGKFRAVISKCHH